MVDRRTMRWVVPAIVAAAAPALAGQAQVAQAPSPTQVPPPAEAVLPPAAPTQAVQGQAQAGQAQTVPPLPPPPGPVFVIYQSNPPSRTTILLNTLTGETWLLGVSGPDGQYQWTRIAVADPSETATAPR